MKIQVKINGQFVEIDLDKCAIKSVSKDKYESVQLCVESEPNGFLIPFAEIELYDDGRFISRQKTFQDAKALGEMIENAIKDAKRYQWLRERNLDTVHSGGVFVGITPDNFVLNGDDMDKAIDDAMLAEYIDGTNTPCNSLT